MHEPSSTTPGGEALDAAIKRSEGSVRRSRRQRGFLNRLGLALPVTVDDVKQAFYAKARAAHPDHRGDATEFKEVQRAFDEAVAFAERNGKRLPWLGAQMPIYVAQRAVIDRVEQLGGRVSVSELNWLGETVGEDFAQLADRLVQIDLTNLPIGDAELNGLLEDPDGVQFVETILLADTRVGDASVMRLGRAPSLRHVDLRGTRASYRLRRQLAQMPGMRRVEGLSRWREVFVG